MFAAAQTAACLPMNGQDAKGTIFNIMRFSTHDGPGIRTTVFLKGCPLNCWWCHNPENWQQVPGEVYLADRCAGCGVCIRNCPSGALSRGPSGIAVDPDLCRHCHRCIDACPMEARESTVRTVGVGELMRSIERDMPFFEQSGGGVTFSGGEPLCQPDFLLAMLTECGRLDIHRAVDTSGFAAEEVLMRAAARTDLFLYDLKVMDPQKHRAHTGVDNAGILANLKQLSAAGADIVIRIPLVPGVNDAAEDLDAAGEFISGLPRPHPVHLLPFHRAAAAKYKKLGLCYRGQDVLPPSAEQVADAARRLAHFGLKVETGG
jgi:pyruvate formate lyase activating enzyme